MVLPLSANAISVLNVRDEYVGKTVFSTTYSSSNTDLMNMGYYRSKYHYNSSGVLTTFPTPTIAMSNFHGTRWDDPAPPPPPPPPGGGCP